PLPLFESHDDGDSAETKISTLTYGGIFVGVNHNSCSMMRNSRELMGDHLQSIDRSPIGAGSTVPMGDGAAASCGDPCQSGFMSRCKGCILPPTVIRGL